MAITMTAIATPHTSNTSNISTDAQIRFDETYITAAEIMRNLNLSRAGLLYARRTGKLPDPIALNDGRLFIWEKETIQPYLDTYKVVLNARRGV